MLSINEEAFMQGFRNGPNSDNVVLVDEGRKDLNTKKRAVIGPRTNRHLNGH